jgi:hypothetical protein
MLESGISLDRTGGTQTEMIEIETQTSAFVVQLRQYHV